MKITPFQLALKNEINRIERLSNNYSQGNHSLVAYTYVKPIKPSNFLLQLFRNSLRISF